jgi:GTP-binding protein
MKFVDEVTVDVRSGDGGPGSVHFMRQKYMPKMGPDGGDGGRGGHVFFEATHDMQSLLDFKYRARYEANNGDKGMGSDCNGRDGEDLLVKVPVGTTLKDAETGNFLADLVEPGVKVLLMRGGRGGLGNMNFATASRQAPDFAQPGEPGEHRRITLELKLLADVGLVGFPNAGKSTFVSRVSAAKPKIADYPFTTLVPNLGVVRGQSRDFVIADIPGIIEGASEGKGLGVQFLKHCERTRALVIVLDLDPHTGRNLAQEYDTLIREMTQFSPSLGDKPRVVALNKMDAFGSKMDDPIFKLHLEDKGFPELETRLKAEGLRYFWISAVSGFGVGEVVKALEAELSKLGPRDFKNTVSTTQVLGNAGFFEDDSKDNESDDSDLSDDSDGEENIDEDEE